MADLYAAVADMSALTLPMAHSARVAMKTLLQRMLGQDDQRSASTPLFRTGTVVATAAALRALRDAGVSAKSLVRRHARGDWGDVDDLDARQNMLALRFGLRLLSAYVLPSYHPSSGEEACTVWVVTPQNRKTTIVLLPGEIYGDTCIRAGRLQWLPS